VIYEDTAVTGLGPGRVRTDRGTVTAPVVVRATEAFTPQLAAYRGQVVPLYSMALATAPLSGALREELGLGSRIAFNDLRNLRIYAHPTADGRLVFGGRGAPYHFGSAISPRHTAGAGRSVFPATGFPRPGTTRRRAWPGPARTSGTAWPPATWPGGSCAT